ncbi:MAG: MFS transporter [Lachnospiraceae bacterium]|nr:MFS transporter [Lachnospiraceae bacterium]
MNETKMNWGRAVLISLPFFALTLFWQAYDYVVPLILSQHYNMGTTVYSMIMSADNVIALIFMPLFGILSDRITGRFGRRTPIILAGTLGGIAGSALMSIEDASAVNGSVRFLPFLIFLLITVFFMSLYRSPAAALSADCFIRPQRTMANAVLNLMGGLGGVLFGVIGHMLIKERNNTTIFTYCLVFVMLSMFAATSVYLITVRERKFVDEVREKNEILGLMDEKTDIKDRSLTRLTDSERKSLILILCSVLFIYMGYNGFHTHYTNFLIRYLHKSASWTGPYLLEVGIGMFMMIPAAFITSVIGRKKSCITGMAACITGYALVSTVTPEHVNMIYIWFLIAAIGFPLFAINLGPMILELGKDNDLGRYMGFYYAAVTGAQIITPTLASLFINTFSYRIIGIYGSICTAVALLLLIPTKHGDVKPDFIKAFEDSAAIDE